MITGVYCTFNAVNILLDSKKKSTMLYTTQIQLKESNVLHDWLKGPVAENSLSIVPPKAYGELLN